MVHLAFFVMAENVVSRCTLHFSFSRKSVMINVNYIKILLASSIARIKIPSYVISCRSMLSFFLWGASGINRIFRWSILLYNER